MAQAPDPDINVPCFRGIQVEIDHMLSRQIGPQSMCQE